MLVSPKPLLCQSMQQNFYEGVYGLTGIIGSGKSSAAGMLAAAGATVIDADALAREILEPDYTNSIEIHTQIKETFSRQRADLYHGGSLNRQALGQLVFGDEKQLQKLNEIMHPHVQLLFTEKRRAVAPGGIIIYDVPLLFEVGLQRRLKKTIVVYCPEQVAIGRAAERLGVSEAQIKKRVGAQISIEEKKKQADYILDNSGSLEELEAQVKKLYQKIKNGEF